MLDSNGYHKTKRCVVGDEKFEEYKCIPSNVLNGDFIFNGEEFNSSYKQLDINWKDMRTYYIYNKKKEIIKSSGCPDIKYNTEIYSHILDKAIQTACAGVKSCQTNLVRHNIHKYKIRPWKYNRKILTMGVEKGLFIHNTFCKEVLGTVKAFKDNKEFKLSSILETYKVDCSISYNREHDKFTLYIPTKPEAKEKADKRKVISLDPGLRTFLTGISENEVIKIGKAYNNETKSITKVKRYVRKIINIKKK